jgi:hypothetical protein
MRLRLRRGENVVGGVKCVRELKTVLGLASLVGYDIRTPVLSMTSNTTVLFWTRLWRGRMELSAGEEKLVR